MVCIHKICLSCWHHIVLRKVIHKAWKQTSSGWHAERRLFLFLSHRFSWQEQRSAQQKPHWGELLTTRVWPQLAEMWVWNKTKTCLWLCAVVWSLLRSCASLTIRSWGSASAERKWSTRNAQRWWGLTLTATHTLLSILLSNEKNKQKNKK